MTTLEAIILGFIDGFNPLENGTDQYRISDYHGYFTEDVITVITPVISNYMPKGYLLVHKHLSDLKTLHKGFMKTVYITFFVIYLLSFSILLVFRFIVYKPLRKITEAAKQYASGNLDYEIPIKTEDEMGYLSSSLNYMSSQLRDMDDYQKKFVANVSHDLKTPIGIIEGYAEGLKDGIATGDDAIIYLETIIDEAHKMQNPEGITHDAYEHIADFFQRVILMTATPYSSCLSQFYGLIHLIYPNIWKSKRAFYDRYIEEIIIKDPRTHRPVRKEKIAYKNLKEFRSKIEPFTYFYYP